MKSLNPFSVPLSGFRPLGVQTGEAVDVGFFLRFPHGVCPVASRAGNDHERAFYARYLNDIQFLIDSDRDAWADRRLCQEDENNPFIEFDPEWFSFLLQAKEKTKTELFAWYWLWVEGDRMLSVSRFAFEELEASFAEASGYSDVFADIYPLVDAINRSLDAGADGDDELEKHLVQDVNTEDFRQRLQGERLWFLDLLVDYEPPAFPGYGGECDDSALAVRIYRVAGEPSLSAVTGQVRAVYQEGHWRIDPRPATADRWVQDYPLTELTPLSAGT